jgi:hypothetical protein
MNHPAAATVVPATNRTGQPHPSATMTLSNPLQDAGQVDLQGVPIAAQHPAVQIVERV